VGYKACMGEIRNAHRILVGKPQWKRKFERLRVDGKISLKWILN